MTPESVAIVFLFFHLDRVFADLNAAFFFQVSSLSQGFTFEVVGKSVLSNYGKVTISNQCCEIFLPCRKLCSTNQNQSARRLPQGLLWALKRAKPCRGRALQFRGWRPIASPSQEEQTDAFGKSAAATVIVALTKHSRCQRGVVDRGDLRSVQIESVFGGK